jgi:hypothetical protein
LTTPAVEVGVDAGTDTDTTFFETRFFPVDLRVGQGVIGGEEGVTTGVKEEERTEKEE